MYHTQVNKWTDQPTLELMRQLVEYSGFCFLDKDKRGDFKTCEDVYYIGAMGHPGGGRNDIPNRLKRQFYTINLTPPSINSINDIYGQMLAGRFPARQTETDLKLVVNALTKATIKLWTFMQNKMLPTPAKRVAASFPALDGLGSFNEPVRTASSRDGSNSTKRPPRRHRRDAREDQQTQHRTAPRRAGSTTSSTCATCRASSRACWPCPTTPSTRAARAARRARTP